MKTRMHVVSAGSLAVVLGLATATAGCGKYSFSSLMGMRHVKEAHELYKSAKWSQAAAKYEEAVKADPTLSGAHFFLANSYDNMYKPSRAGEPENDAVMQKAIQWYKTAAEKEPDPVFRQRAMEYLVAAYAPDKLNNPAEAEPIVKQMIELQPNEYINYLALAKIYETAGRYDEAEAALMKAREIKPNEASVYTTMAGYYNTQGNFDKTIEALQMAADTDPNNPLGYYTIATFFEEKVRKDTTLTPVQQRDYLAKGLTAADKALSLNDQYAEAMVYKNILLRRQGNLEKPGSPEQKALFAQADELRNKAMELNKKKASDAASGQGAKPATK